MTDDYEAQPDDHFTFGLWTVGNRGRDTFGNETRPPLDPGRCGAPPRRARRVRRELPRRRSRAARLVGGRARADPEAVPASRSTTTGLKVPMATTNLFSNPVFKEGAFTANDPAVRRCAITKTLDAIDLGVELGAAVYVMWGGREGIECDAAKDVRARARPLQGSGRHLLRVRRATVATTCASRSSRSRTSRAATSCSRRSATRSRSSSGSSGPTWSASTPSSRTRRCRGCRSTTRSRRRCGPGSCSTSTSTAKCIGKYDQDFRFGSEGIRDAFYLVKLLEDAEWHGHAPLRRARVPHRGRRRACGSSRAAACAPT